MLLNTLIHYLPFSVRRSLLALVARYKYGVRLGHATLIGSNTFFEGMNVVMDDCTVTGSFIGRGTYIAAGSVIRKSRIGRFCSIGSQVRSSLGRHPTTGFVSTHPAFFSQKMQAGFTFVDNTLFEEHVYIGDSGFTVHIGNDVWIGDNVMIADGVEIGDGAVVGAGAIVTKSLNPYSINLGIPAREVRQRFGQEIIDQLLQIRWWDRDLAWIRQHAPLFVNVEDFVTHIENQQN